MATYLAHDALPLTAASLLANSGLCVNIEIKIWLLLGVNVDTANKQIRHCSTSHTALLLGWLGWWPIAGCEQAACKHSIRDRDTPRRKRRHSVTVMVRVRVRDRVRI